MSGSATAAGRRLVIVDSAHFVRGVRDSGPLTVAEAAARPRRSETVRVFQSLPADGLLLHLQHPLDTNEGETQNRHNGDEADHDSRRRVDEDATEHNKENDG